MWDLSELSYHALHMELQLSQNEEFKKGIEPFLTLRMPLLGEKILFLG